MNTHELCMISQKRLKLDQNILYSRKIRCAIRHNAVTWTCKHSHTCRELKLQTEDFKLKAWRLNMLKRTTITGTVSPKLYSMWHVRCWLHLKTQIPWLHLYFLSKTSTSYVNAQTCRRGRASPRMMPFAGVSADGGDLDEALYQMPSCSTLVCGFVPFSPSSLHAEGCCFPHIASVPGKRGWRDRKWDEKSTRNT